jgi:hypothetical protein
VNYHLVIRCERGDCPALVIGPAVGCFGVRSERRQLIADALDRGWSRFIDEHGDRWYCPEHRPEYRTGPDRTGIGLGAPPGIPIPEDCPF